MDESLMEQRRVSEEGFRIVKLCCWRRTGTRVTVGPLKTEQSFVNVIGLFDLNRRELNMSEVNSQTTNRAIQITHYMRV